METSLTTCRFRFIALTVLLLVMGAWLLPAPASEAPAESAERVTIQVAGIAGPALDNVRTALELPRDLITDGVVDRPWLERFRRQIPRRVRQALEPYGYFEPQVKVAFTEQPGPRYLIEVTVDPGEPVRIGQVRVLLEGPGREEAKLEHLVAEPPLVSGDLLRQDRYDAYKGRLKARAIELGYLQADFSRHRLAVSLANHRADIDLVLQTGPLFFFGNPLIHGAPDFPDPFLRRYLAFRPGERFAYRLLGKTQIRYLDSDRFKDVLITPHLELAADQQVPVSIQLVPSDPRRLRPGVGYGTDTGPRFSLRYQDVNVFQLGHELKLETSLSPTKQAFTGRYLLPSPAALENVTALRFDLTREKTDTYTSRSISSEIERIHSLGPGLLGSVFLRLLQEDYRVGTVDQRSRLVLPGLRFSWQQLQDPIRPRQGFGLSAEVRGARKALASDLSLLQILVDGNLLVPLPWRLSLLTRGQVATTLLSDPLAEIPASLRFFAGGDKSVRGYDYQSLGPRDENGVVVGGKNLVTASVELERAIGKNWGVAAFYDIGNAFNNIRALQWAQGAGLGLRYYTLVGPLRIDLARRVGGMPSAYRLHLSVGFSW